MMQRIVVKRKEKNMQSLVSQTNLAFIVRIVLIA